MLPGSQASRVGRSHVVVTITVIYIAKTIRGTRKVGRLSLILVLILFFAVSGLLMISRLLMILRIAMASCTVFALRILTYICL